MIKLIVNNIKKRYIDIIRFFPVQLFLLHFRKYQVLLLFWLLIIGVINGNIFKNFGLEDIMLAPEYFGEVSLFSYLILGMSFGIFVIIWNITTFVLHTKRFSFLATTHRPFLKYCINNAIIPMSAFFYILYKVIAYQHLQLLAQKTDIILHSLGFIIGFIIVIFISFIYFFSADKGVVKWLKPIAIDIDYLYKSDNFKEDKFGLKIDSFISDKMKIRKTRSVSHYNPAFLSAIFKRHHFAAIAILFITFLLLTATGLFYGNSLFKIPAAASFLVLFALAIGVVGALSYFLESWSIVFVIIFVFVLNLLYKNDIIDPRNKAYGLAYNNKANRPAYTKSSIDALCTADKMAADKKNMLIILENWKAKQKEEKPILYLLNVSGGGLRSACFVTKCLQELDKVYEGKLMDKTFMIAGASGGMLGATYYRSWKQKHSDSVTQLSLQTKAMNNITNDLLNPIMSSLVVRDIFAPVQKFNLNKHEYIKDRGYAFEQSLNANTENLLNRSFASLQADEFNANIPLQIFASTITADGRKMMMCSQPISFLMRAQNIINDSNFSADAVDFGALFANQTPHEVTLLTALRMNATFPYILPSVWLPTSPIIDVMDAGLRDNYGLETSYRFVHCFRDWITQNTGGIAIIQIRDRKSDNWYNPYLMDNIADLAVKPGTMLQLNYHKLVDYGLTNQFDYLQKSFAPDFINKVVFQYIPQSKENEAALNFHISPKSKQDLILSFDDKINQTELKKLIALNK